MSHETINTICFTVSALSVCGLLALSVWVLAGAFADWLYRRQRGIKQ